MHWILFGICVVLWLIGLYFIWIRPSMKKEVKELTEEDLIKDTSYMPNVNHVAAVQLARMEVEGESKVAAVQKEFVAIVTNFKKYVFSERWDKIENFCYKFNIDKTNTPVLFEMYEESAREQIRKLFEGGGYLVDETTVENAWEEVFCYRYEIRIDENNISLTEIERALEEN